MRRKAGEDFRLIPATSVCQPPPCHRGYPEAPRPRRPNIRSQRALSSLSDDIPANHFFGVVVTVDDGDDVPFALRASTTQ